MQFPKITVITVNYNLADYLEATLKSVLDQNYPNLEYIVIDGGSTDGSVEIIQKYADRLAYWESAKDEGFIHALQKGFSKSTGEIMGWLNSDDLYFPGSLFAVAAIFNQFPQVDWLMGLPAEWTDKGYAISRATLPYARWTQRRYLTCDFQFIMQEATFWRRSLWEKAGSKVDTDLKMAVDTELWARFFRHAKLHTTTTLLGGFRFRKSGQKSRAGLEIYLEECRQVMVRERKRLPLASRIFLPFLRPLRFLLGLPWYLDLPVLRAPYGWLMGMPPVISFDYDRQEFFLGRRQLKHPPLLVGGKQISRKKSM
ncbi:MAG: glycosyltransferase [Bacteroidia bacterium]|nr:glycosyltransferase [Bacteroidia bacterium]